MSSKKIISFYILIFVSFHVYAAQQHYTIPLHFPQEASNSSNNMSFHARKRPACLSRHKYKHQHNSVYCSKLNNEQNEQSILALDEKLQKFSWAKKIVNFFTGHYTPGLKNEVHILAEAIYLEKKRKTALQKQNLVRKQYQKQEKIRSYFTPILTDQHTRLIRKCSDSNIVSKLCYEKRHVALNQAYQNLTWSHKNCAITTQVKNLGHKYGLNENLLTNLYGTQLQHVLHAEFLDLLNVIGHAKTNKYQKIIVECVDVGLSYNHAGNVAQSWGIADICWSLYDCLIKAPIEGVIEGVNRFGHAVMHPIETIKGLLDGIKMVCEFSMLGEFAYINNELFRLREYGIEKITDQQTINYVKKRHEQLKNISDVLFNTWQQSQWSDVIKEGVAFVTEAFLFGKFCHALGNVAKIAEQEAFFLIQKMKKSSAPKLNAALAADCKLYYAFDELTEYAGYELSGELAGAIETDVLVTIPKKIPHYIPLEAELPYLQDKFRCIRKGFNEFKNKFIKIAYEHILAPDIKMGKGGERLSGLHHDFMGYFEETNFVEMIRKVENEFGYYKADILWKGEIYKDKTFFPKEWPREKVIEKIYEAYGEFMRGKKKPVLGKDGKYKIRGMTKEGIDIEMVITQKGKITTAYPKL